MKKWIIFDVMGVIFTVGDDTNNLLVPFIKKRNSTITQERINEVYIDASLGRITSDEFWEEMNITENRKDIYMEYLDTCLTLDKNFIKVAKELKNIYNLGILSNDVSQWSTYLRKKYKIDEIIEFAVISGDVKCRKPNKEIYKMAIKQTGTEAKNCVFIDDRDKNLVPAIEQGMHVIKFLRDDKYTELKNVPVINSFLELQAKVNDVFSR